MRKVKKLSATTYRYSKTFYAAIPEPIREVLLWSSAVTEMLALASCLIYAKPLRHPSRAFIEYICGCFLFQDVTVREIRGR